MTNEQAKELAEKVWPEIGWVDYRSYAEEKERYSVCKGSDIYNAKSYEEAFLAAGVEITLACEDCPSRCVPELNCEWTYSGDGIGYRLTEGRKP